jgi:hypothetical protein
MDFLLDWIDKHQFLTGCIVFLLGGGSGLGAAKAIVKLTPTKLDDVLLHKITEICEGANSIGIKELEERLTNGQINEIVRLRKDRLVRRHKDAMAEASKR